MFSFISLQNIYYDVAFQIGCSDLETLLLKDKTTFPDNPSVWLKDLAAYLNVKLDCVAEPDPVFEGKPQGKHCYRD